MNRNRPWISICFPFYYENHYLLLMCNWEHRKTEHLTNDLICDLVLGLLWLCRVTADKPLVCSALQLSQLSMQMISLTSVETTVRDWWTVLQSSWVVLLLHITDYFFLPENLKGLGLQTNAPAMVVYLGLVYISFRVEKGDPPGALKVAWVEDYEFFP